MASADFKEELYKQQTSLAIFTLVKITHSEITSLLLVDNTEVVTYGGDDYQPIALKFSMPDDNDDVKMSSTLVIDNVDRETLLELRKISNTVQPTVKITIISDYNSTQNLEKGPYTFNLVNATYNVSTISLSLEYDDELRFDFPALRFNADVSPGMYK